MGKLVIAISAAITAFIMALTAGAIYAYRTMSSSSTGTQQPVSQVGAPVQVAAADPSQAQATAVTNISPQDAAAIAAKSLNRTDVYSVALADAKGTPSYMVTFSSGDVVYVSLQGQVVASMPPPTPAVVYSAASGGGNHSGGGGGGGNGDDHEHEHEGGD